MTFQEREPREFAAVRSAAEPCGRSSVPPRNCYPYLRLISTDALHESTSPASHLVPARRAHGFCVRHFLERRPACAPSAKRTVTVADQQTSDLLLRSGQEYRDE
jgi:hypothetical protein